MAKPLDWKALAAIRRDYGSKGKFSNNDVDGLLALMDELHAALKHCYVSDCSVCKATVALLARIALPEEKRDDIQGS